ncbi:hypothetical protein PLESTB_000020600 [Pleodorina starrii]|uniref:Uncharacterized protein n=1 Tax=Pleodorina starrii TaxID=330485 RepID=A0A9W6B865_9CHLO|nr:hypothetical protein PLESTM_001114200 [Pleodorina starrii]GLC47739.1 hypothetical protein PLESTB_000020600 [Pleodorina starrii]GLC70849.1 hypothetical protein PLESTF_001039600 [Pleodorina starrii]
MASFKDQGNEEFKKENYLKAAALYTQAIKEDPQNAVLYSNRSAALLKLNKVTKAMEDADKCISLKPDWEKGYFRKAAVLEAQDKMHEALEVYQSVVRLNGGEGASTKELSNKIRSLTKLLKIKSSSHKEDTLESVLLAAVGANAQEQQQQQLASFCRDLAAMTLDNVAESGTAFTPSLHFLPGPGAESHEEREAHIQAAHAFSNPDALGEFVVGMRAESKRLGAVAAVAVVPKAAVSFPQLWLRKPWPSSCGSKQQAGVFVQLEGTARGPAGRHIWFLPVRADKSTSPPVSLNFDDFGLLPQLLLQ